MAKLSAAQRKKLPASTFAGPGRSFPIPDKPHATAALRLVGRALHAGHITQEEAAHIKARARAKLGQTAKAEDKPKRKAPRLGRVAS